MIIAKMLWKFDMDCQADVDWMSQRIYMLWDKKSLMMKLVPVRNTNDHF